MIPNSASVKQALEHLNRGTDSQSASQSSREARTFNRTGKSPVVANPKTVAQTTRNVEQIVVDQNLGLLAGVYSDATKAAPKNYDDQSGSKKILLESLCC